MQIIGIVNVTRDSFSDGGRYLNAPAAVEHARRLLAEGATIIDVGAESTHPDAEDVPAAVQIERLTPVVAALKTAGASVSVDTYQAEVMRVMLALGVDYVNDVTALRDTAAVAAVRDSDVRLIIMHSTCASARAQRQSVAPTTIVARIEAFFAERIAELEAAGIRRERLILDPGMGFFLGSDPQVSLEVLRNLRRLKAFGLPVCVSTSRKSFIGAMLGTPQQPREVARRGAGTLATELWALSQGVDYIRTHEVAALRDAVTIWEALANGPRDSTRPDHEELR